MAMSGKSRGRRVATGLALIVGGMVTTAAGLQVYHSRITGPDWVLIGGVLIAAGLIVIAAVLSRPVRRETPPHSAESTPTSPGFSVRDEPAPPADDDAEEAELSLLPVNWESWFPVQDGLPRPDWSQAAAWIDTHHAEDEAMERAWQQATLAWLGKLGEALGSQYVVDESEAFLLLSTGPEEFAVETLRSLEAMRKAILSLLGEMAWNGETRLHPILTLDSHEQYYTYVSHFYPEEGRFPQSGGVFIDKGVPHIALPRAGGKASHVTLFHELVHSATWHLPQPQWLREGIATGLATESQYPTWLAARVHRENTKGFQWSSRTIQRLWSGEAFHRMESSRSAYDLAHMLVRSLGRRRGFREFVRDANRADAGGTAAKEHLGVTLGEALAAVLGPGDWEPREETWPKEDSEPKG